MKKLSLILLFIYTHSVFANQQEQTITSSINGVTVFLKGAQVFREAKTTLKPGTNTIIIDNVSPHLNKKSLQAFASNGALILDVKHNIFYNEPLAIKPKVVPARIQKEIDLLNDSILFKQYEIDMIRTLKNNLVAEKNIIINSKTMRGEGDSDSLAILIEAVKFYRKRMEEIEQKIFSVKLKEHRMTLAYDKMNLRLQELKNYNQHVQQPKLEKKQIHQIILTVSSETTLSTTIKVNYLVNNAGWFPSYDLRAKTGESMQLTYKASVFQRTEENWDNVKLTLSTYNQNCQFSVPELATWNLGGKKIRTSTGNIGYHSMFDSTMVLSNAYIPIEQSTFAQEVPDNPMDDFLTSIANNDMHSALNNVEFEIKQRYSIASDGQQVLMVVKNDELVTSFDHMAIPKVNADVFLLGKITDWKDLNLLHAKANIYFNNTYVGETQINPNILGDTLDVALARERGIMTSRKKTKDDDKKSSLGKNISREITIELAVKNNKNNRSKIQLKDQIPVSKQKDIAVKLLKSDGAQLNEETGLLTWDLDLKPNEKKVISFTYKVEYDKDDDVM